MRWNLRLAAANRGIWKASELQRMLAELLSHYKDQPAEAKKLLGVGEKKADESLDAGTTVGMLVHDGGLPYLPTVYDDEWVAGNLGDVDAIEAALERTNPFSTR